MADFTLVVGVDTSLSFTEMQNGINEIVSKLNANPPKIKVQFDDASLKTMQSQISKLQESINTGTTKAPVNAKALGEVATQASKAAGAVQNMNKALDSTASATKAAEKAEKERLSTQKAAAAAVKSYNTAIVQGEQALRNWSAAERSKNEESRTAYQALKSSIDAMRNAKASYDSGTGSIDNLRAKTEAYKNTLKTTEQVLRANGDATRTLGERLGSLASKFSSWLSVSQVIMLAVRAVREMVSASIELESSFAQLEIVTGASEAEMRQFKDTAASLAHDLGQSVSDVTKSIEVFSRLGYSLPDASVLAQYATILANVAAVSTEEATTGLTSIIKGFNLDVSDAEHVADVLIEVGQKYAVSAGEMMEAYERSGAALNATNTSFEKSAGLIAAANAAVQDSSTVGTALKTISARIRGSKTDLEELGESTEDLANGFSKYADEIKALTGFDIMVDGTTDTFKDLYDIMEGVAGVWDRLTDTQQARVAEILGGTRQLQVISSILGNWGDAAGAYETAMNSAGAATKANDIYMETAAAHIKQFKAAFQELSSNLIGSGFITSVVDFGTHILQILNAVAKVIDALGGLNTVLKVTAGILLTIHADEVLDFLTSIPRLIKNALPILGTFGTTFKAVFDAARVDGASSFRAFFTGVRGGFSEMIASASAAQIAMGSLVAAIGIATIAINALEQAERKRRQAQEDAYNTSLSAAKETENVYELYAAYNDAKKAADDNTASKQALESATRSLAEALGVEGEAAGNTADELERLTLAELDNAKHDAEAAVIAAREKLVGNMRTFKDSEEKGLVGYWTEAFFGVNPETASIEESAKALQGVYQMLIDKRNELIDSGEQESALYKRVTAAIALLQGDIGDLSTAESVLTSTEERYQQVLNGTATTQETVAETAEETAEAIEHVAKNESEAAKGMLRTLWNSEDFGSTKSSLIEMANTLDGISPKNIEDLSASSKELAAVLEMDGMNAQFLSLILQKEALGGNGFDLITESALRLNSALDAVQTGLKAASEELQKYQDATSIEKGVAAEQYGTAYKKFAEDWETGRTGTNAVRAAVELFIPDTVLQSLDYDLQAAGELLSTELYQRIFSDEGDYGANFANYIRETFGDALDGIVEITENGDSFEFAVSSYQAFADALGMDVNLVVALMDALDAYGTQAMISAEDTAKLAQELGLLNSNASNLSKVQSAIDGLANVGKAETEIRQILDLLASAGYIDLSGVENLGQKIGEAVQAAHEVDEVEAQPTITVDISGVEEGVADAQGMINSVHGKTVAIVTNHYDNYYSNNAGTNGSSGGTSSTHKLHYGARAGGTRNAPGGDTLVNELGPELISENGEAYIAGNGEPTVVDLSPGAIVLDAETTKKALRGDVKQTSQMGAMSLGSKLSSAWNKVKDFGSKIGKAVTTAVNYAIQNFPKPTTTTTATKTGGTVSAGTRTPGGAKATTSKPASAKNTASVVSSTVATRGGSNATVPIYGGGSSGGGGSYGSGGGGSYGGGSYGSGASSPSGSSEKEETWFEKLYAEHNHLLKMDKESQQDYLTWLEGAYKQAYNEGIIDLNDYRKYEEEVYKGRQDDFKDHLSDTEHLIDMEKNGNNNPVVILNMYQQMLNDIQNELNNAYANGLDANDDYVQYLQNQWYKYNDDMKAAQEDATDEAENQVKDLVDYRIKMLKQYIKNEINSLKDRLSYLKDFYSKQKEMLQEVYDTENYLAEQSEKRKNVSDIQNELQALEFDDSAWAQKRKLQLQQELDDAQKELDDFERQHALSVAQEQLDAAYNIQESAINARIDQLNNKLEDPQYLYETALRDVQNNSIALYEEMIDFNNKYGSGIKQDIVNMWEEAYISLKKYSELHGELYKGISLVNATGYIPDSSYANLRVPRVGYASGTSNATPGLHRVDEFGSEYVFTSSNGNRYRLLSGGDKVLNSKATEFLYNFATTGSKVIPSMIANSLSGASGIADKPGVIGEINMGDIIIQGNADERTVSEIRRAQRESVDFMLKEFNRLKK